MNDKVYALIGLACKAGKVKSGEVAVEKSIGAKKAVLVVTATDASENTKKAYRDKCAYYAVPYIEYGTKVGLGKSLGKAERSGVAVEDEGFANALRKRIDGGKGNGED